MNIEKQRSLELLNAERDFIERRIDQLKKEIDNLESRLDDIGLACLLLEDEKMATYELHDITGAHHVIKEAEEHCGRAIDYCHNDVMVTQAVLEDDV